jgi:hypothetical protein
MPPEPQIVTAAFAPGEIFPYVFIIIALISGIRNFLKERGNAQQIQEMRKTRKQDQGLGRNDEISQFLNDVGTTKKKSPPQRKKRSSQRQQAQKRRTRREAIRDQPTRNDGHARKSQAESSRVSDRHLNTEDLGSVREHHLESTVKDRHLESEVADQHLFDDNGQSQQVTKQQRDLHPVAALLREPSGICNAILLNEILQPPLSRRKR